MIRAPGKLFLFGEYAVLGGAPAIVTAVDRYVSARRCEGPYRVVGTHEPDVRLPRAVEAATGHAVTGWEVDVSSFYERDQKLGLGSSAASCVALAAAALGVADRQAVFEAALRAHRGYQGGRGSGADVAASTFGGTLVARPVGEGLHVTPVRLPNDLRVYPIWTGAPADTRSFVDVVLKARPAALDALAALAAEAEVAFERDDAGAIVELAQLYDEAEGRLGGEVGVAIRTATHEAVARAAQTLGAAAKPSGAGGGDVSLVVSEGPLDEVDLASALPPGARLLDFALGAAGVNSFPDPA